MPTKGTGVVVAVVVHGQIVEYITYIPSLSLKVLRTDKGHRIINQNGSMRKSKIKKDGPPTAATTTTSILKKGKSQSTPDLSSLDNQEFNDINNNDNNYDNDTNGEFVIRRKDDKMISNRDFNTYVRPKPRRSTSPTRAVSRTSRRTQGNKAVEAIPNLKYEKTVLSSTPANGHVRSKTAPTQYLTPVRDLRRTFDDMSLSSSFRRRTRTASPNLHAALDSSFRIQRRVDDVIRKRDYSLDSDNESDFSLDVLRESLREERNALNDAIREADREAYYRSLNRSLRL